MDLRGRREADGCRAAQSSSSAGGDGVVAITAFTGAGDDHTLLMSPTSSFTHHPWMHDKMPYDPRDLVPLADEIERAIRANAGLIVDKMLHAAPEGTEAADAEEGPDADGVLPDADDEPKKGARARK